MRRDDTNSTEDICTTTIPLKRQKELFFLGYTRVDSHGKRQEARRHGISSNVILVVEPLPAEEEFIRHHFQTYIIIFIMMDRIKLAYYT